MYVCEQSSYADCPMFEVIRGCGRHEPSATLDLLLSALSRNQPRQSKVDLNFQHGILATQEWMACGSALAIRARITLTPKEVMRSHVR
jgi:hypothetical protein